MWGEGGEWSVPWRVSGECSVRMGGEWSVL